MGLVDRLDDARERAGWWLSERLPQPVVQAAQTSWYRARWLGRGVQRVVVTVLLVVLYVLGIGATRLLVTVAARRFLGLYAMGPEQDSYWVNARSHELDERYLHGQF